ncbi:energy-coupling factor transporter transmembrane component T family protein [Rhizobium terrae]|uniref:energy-coupling factor transporter transmembrane component T family protein n=1 Tax=Rhizobium terrae TaxID=2171756 RepID=UPI000E3DB5B8|nr:energy-coupling factor transporter transmembrane protein EcfT [Rhizobium terrae]
MKTLYVEGNTLLHRLSARVKLAALAMASMLLFVADSPVLLAPAAIAAAALYGTLGLGWRNSWQRLRAILLTIVIVSAFMLVINDPGAAATGFFRLTALAFFAATITATTSTGDFIATISSAARPLERTGLGRAADIGLAIGLVIRFVPDVLGRYQAIRDAHRARGLKPSALTLGVPLIILTLRNADEIAAAIDARGIRGQNWDKDQR